MSEIPDRPPRDWFNETFKEVKQSLRDAHPDWKEETLEDKARQTVGDIWYNKLSPEKKQELVKKEGQDQKDYQQVVDTLEEDYADMTVSEEKVLKADEVPLPPDLNRREEAVGAVPKEKVPEQAASTARVMRVPSFKFNYTATPKFEGKEGPIIIKALVLEEGANINNWRVVRSEFENVAAQYKGGRQLRVNHSKDVQHVIGKSFNGLTLTGKDVAGFLGREIEGIVPDGLYVGAEFEANPQDPQIRTNILDGYVETGSIGLDASAYCDECGKPLERGENDEMKRTCRHLDAPVKLTDVDIKEYSYVAEPAFEHTMAFPSFSAAVDERLRIGRSSLSQSSSNPSRMPEATAAATAAVTATAAKKAEGKSEGEGDGQADAAALALYKQGQADALKMFGKLFGDAAKYRAGKPPSDDDQDDQQKAEGAASAEGEGEGKETASAEGGPGFAPMKGSAQSSRKTTTDQIATTGKTASTAPITDRETLMARVLRPTETAMKMEPWLKEVFRASVEHTTAPPDLRAKYKGLFQ